MSVVYSAKRLEIFGEEVSNNWGLNRSTALPDTNFTIAWGRVWSHRGVKFGAFAAGLWKNSWEQNEFDRKYFIVGQEGSLEQSHQYHFSELKNGIRLSGALTLTAEWDGNEITTVTLLNRSSDLSTRTYSGLNRDVDAEIEVTRTGWKERQLFFEQIRGKHAIGESNQLD